MTERRSGNRLVCQNAGQLTEHAGGATPVTTTGIRLPGQRIAVTLLS
jgi:hypothetical protein